MSLMQKTRLLFGLSLLWILAACGGGNEEKGHAAAVVSDISRAGSLAVAATQEQLPTVIQLTKVSESRVGRTTFDYVFKISVRGGSIDFNQTVARVIRTGAGTSILKGESQIGEIAAGAILQPSDTITLRHDRVLAFDASAVQWEIVASATPRAIEATPAAVTFTGSGQTKSLKISVLNSAGREIIGAPYTLTSSNPSHISVSQDGSTRSLSATGSAILIASSGALTSKPITATVIETLPGTTMVSDDQVLSQPTLLAGETGNVGSKYVVSVSSILSPTVGNIILASGSASIAGKVINVQASGSGAVSVTYEILPLVKLVRNLNVSLAYPPVPGEIIGTTGVQSQPMSQRLSSSREPQAVKWAFGGFQCKLDRGSVNNLSLETDLETSLMPVYEVSIVDSSLKRLRMGATGSIKYSIAGELKLGEAAVKLDCTKNLGHVPIPLAGFLSALSSPAVPIDVVLSAEASAGAALRWTVEKSWTKTATVGLKYDESTGWAALNEIEGESSSEGTLTPSIGFANIGFSFAAGLGSGLSWKSMLGPTLSVVSVSVMNEYSWTGGPVDVAALDDAFSSEDKTQSVVKISSGDDLQKFISLISPDFLEMNLSASRSHLIDVSPKKKSIEADRSTYKTGEVVRFSVELESGSLNIGPLGLLGYNIDEIRIYRIRKTSPISGEAILVSAVKPVESGQARFELNWLATEDGSITDASGKGNFYAFVVSKRLRYFRDHFPVELGEVKSIVREYYGPATFSGPIQRDDSPCFNGTITFIGDAKITPAGGGSSGYKFDWKGRSEERAPCFVRDTANAYVPQVDLIQVGDRYIGKNFGAYTGSPSCLHICEITWDVEMRIVDEPGGMVAVGTITYYHVFSFPPDTRRTPIIWRASGAFRLPVKK